MHIGILGTGNVGRTLAAALLDRGHAVTLGTRDAAATRARGDGAHGASSFREWQREHPECALGSYAEAARAGEVLFNATSGGGSLEALAQAGAEALGDRILLDLANPLDFSRGMPPTLLFCNTESLGERIQQAYPRLRVVKTLNTVTAPLMVNPGAVAGGEHTIFVCGDDPAARAQVARWLGEWFGWRDVLDLGGIGAARGTEMYLPLWVRLWGALGTPMLNVRIQR
jgi:predicted dinucleotide-binding enzyme